MRFRLSVAAVAVLASTIAVSHAGTTVSSPGSDSQLLRADGGKLLDGAGREVILRGIAVIKKDGDFLPPVTRDDFLRIRSWGMNSIRLGTLWAAIEPAKGTYDSGYLKHFAEIVRTATDAGLYVIVDMHQDLWGPPYGDGAPAWAGQTACPHVDSASITGAWATNYLSPAVMCAFTNFWTSSELQTHYAGAWKAVAALLKDDPMVAGYDLINEPYQGFIPPGVFETQCLYPAQAAWLQAIRSVDPDHVGFLESPNYKNVHMPTVPDPSPPENTAYAPHLYGFWDEVPEQGADLRAPMAEANFRYSVEEARLMGLPMWLGEFGMVHDAPGAQDFARLVYDMADQARAGASWWVYEPGTGYSPVEEDGTPRPILTDIARSYPAAVAGLTSFSFDAGSSVLSAEWTGGGTAVFGAPEIRYPHGVSVVTDGQPEWDPAAGELRVTGGTHLSLRPASA